jgi:general secretion pathway protein H
MGSAVQLLRPPSNKLRVESATRALCSALRATHSRAIATNSEMQLAVNLARKSFASPVARESALPADAAIHVEVADNQKLDGQTAAILFFPDGTSTGGDIKIELPGVRATIGVNWLTGEASCAIA